MDPALILVGIGTLAMYSFLYRENSVYSFFEHFYVAFSAAHFMVMGISYVITYATKGNPIAVVVSVLLGLMMYLFYSKKYFYLYRIPLSFMVGVGTALFIRSITHSILIGQMVGTFLPLIAKDSLTTVNNWIIVFGVIAAAYYFIFTFSQDGIGGVPSRLGRIMLMASFGATFGNIVMTRFATTLSRVRLLLRTDAIYVVPFAIALVALDLFWRHQKKKTS